MLRTVVQEQRGYTFSVLTFDISLSAAYIAVMTTYCSLEYDSDFMPFLYAGFNSLREDYNGI